MFIYFHICSYIFIYVHIFSYIFISFHQHLLTFSLRCRPAPITAFFAQDGLVGHGRPDAAMAFRAGMPNNGHERSGL